MVNEEILAGLKAAVERGQSVKSSMNAFVNAGYSKAEVEEAAKFLEEGGAEKKNIIQEIPPADFFYKQPQKPVFKKLPAPIKIPPAQPIQSLVQEIKPELIYEPKVTTQRPIKRVEQVIYYEEQSPTEKLLIIVLVSFLVFLVGVLILLFVFRKDLINFFSSMFAQ